MQYLEKKWLGQALWKPNLLVEETRATCIHSIELTDRETKLEVSIYLSINATLNPAMMESTHLNAPL